MKIILGVGGGIAAYKSAELARLLMQEGHAVQAVMTRAAQEFISPLTFAALTGRKTLTDLFAIESAIEHIAVAQENELMAIAPAPRTWSPGWPMAWRTTFSPPCTWPSPARWCWRPR